MKHCPLARKTCRLALLALVLGCLARSAGAKEPFEAFLEALRQRQMFDTAREYLETMSTSPLISDEQRSTIPFQRGRILMDEARAQQRMADRLALLDQARAQFEQFLQASPEHALTGETSLELGNVLVERGRALIEAARRPAEAASREQNLAEARKFCTEAEKVFAASQTRFDEELKKFPSFIDNKDTAQLEARNRALFNAMQARLLKATVIYETAATYDEGSRERKKRLEAAAAAFGEIYDEYQRRLAGLYARMYQARCFQDLGDLPQALSYYDDLLAQPDEPDEFRILKRKTLRLAMMCWLDERQNKYDEAIRQGESWLSQARGNEAELPEGLAIRWLTARGYEQRAASLDAKDPRRAGDHRQAVTHATAVARLRGEHQDDARALVARLRPRGDGAVEFTDFATAFDAGKGLLDDVAALQATLQSLEMAGAEESQRTEARDAVNAARTQGMKLFRQALALCTPEVSLDEVNQARYFLCYLHFTAGDYYEAIVLGDFLATRYPSSAGAKPAAKIALASYLELYNAASVNERAFETAGMVSFAEQMAKSWPASPEADEAWMLLADLSLRSGDFTTAAQHLEHIAAESSRFNEAQLKAGQAYWAAYLTAARSNDSRANTAELSQLASQAKTLLERGLQTRLEGKAPPPSPAELAAELSLAQLYLDAGDYARAMQLVDRPETGALALLEAQSPLFAQASLASEAYMVALRAFVGSGQLDKADQVMKILDSRAAESGENAAAMTRVYMNLGVELKEQIERLKEENKTDQLQAVLKTFNQFLDRIAAREQSHNFASLSWMAEAYYSLGEGLSAGDELSPDVQQYFERSAKASQQILERAQTDSQFVPQPAALLAVRLRLARCDRRLSNYQSALRQITSLLGEQPNSLEGQMEAAHIYQAWGKDDPESYGRAWRGRKVKSSDGRLVDIWGWNGIAARLRGNERYRDFYYEAQLNLATCSYLQAMTKSGGERATELNATSRVIAALAKVHPELGGEAWRPRFDALLKNVQRELGQQPLGLPTLERGTTAQEPSRRAA
ncbi:MAG: hypothetical protein KF708_15850 [Pirellulales bacterium]|nr:hypothetical protein [Pirellulales bacterium]